MQYVVIIVIVLWLLSRGVQAAIEHWTVTLPIVIAAFASVVAFKLNETKKVAEERERMRKQAEIEAELKKKAEYEGDQKRTRAFLVDCVSSSENRALEIQEHIHAATEALIESEREFAEGAFAPFWDAVEQAANHLAQSNEGINGIIKRSKNYRDEVIKLDSEPPPFRINVG